MAITLNLSIIADSGGRKVISSNTYSAEAGPPLDVDIADSETDKNVAWSVDVSQLQAIIIQSDQDITIETNNGSAPDDTLVLAAGVPYIWSTDSLDTNLLTTDVTSLYVTNASGATANLQIECVLDATP